MFVFSDFSATIDDISNNTWSIKCSDSIVERRRINQNKKISLLYQILQNVTCSSELIQLFIILSCTTLAKVCK